MDRNIMPATDVFCNQTMSFNLAVEGDDILLCSNIRSRDHQQSVSMEIPIGGLDRMQGLIKEGYHMHCKALLYRSGVAFLLFHTAASKSPDSHYLLCVDLLQRKPLGLLAVSELQPSGRIESLEIFSADTTRDRKYLALAVGVVTGRSYMYMSETGNCFVVLFDMENWVMQMRIETGSYVTPSVAFDPTSNESSPKLTVVHSNSADRPMMATYDVKMQRIVARSVLSSIELDGDTTTQAVYTEDGCFVIVLVLEDMWHDKTSLCRLFAIRASSLTLYHRYPASVVRPCHPDCVFSVMPVLRECGTRFVVQGTRIEKQYQEQTYNVPPPLGLKAMCRMTILRHLPKGLRSVTSLPVPPEVHQYLSFKNHGTLT